MSPEVDRRIPCALFILRFFLATFLLQWGVEKLILPDAAARIARGFYGLTLTAPASYALGVAELILSLAVLFGFYRTISYGLSLLGRPRRNPQMVADFGQSPWVEQLPPAHDHGHGVDEAHP